MTARNQNEGLSIRGRIVELCLAAILPAAVFFFGAASSWAGMFLASALFFLSAVSADSFKPLQIPFFKLFLFIFLFIVFQTVFFSQNRHASYGEILKGCCFLCFFCLVWNLPQALLSRLVWVVILTGIFEVVYGAGEVYSGHEHVLWTAKKNHLGFVTGTYFNRNHLAGFLELCSGLAAGCFMKNFHTKEKGKAAVSAAAFFILTAGLFLSGSRMGVLSFAAAFLIISAASLFKIKKNFSVSPWLFLLAAAVPAAIWGVRPWISRWTELPFLIADGQRLVVWKDTLRIIRDYPLTGTGLGSFEWVFPKYQSAQLVMAWTHAHNGYLELAAELGIPIFLLLTAAFIAFFKFCLSGGVRKHEAGTFWFERGLIAGVLAFLLHGFTDFNFSIPANMLVLVFLLALLFKTRMSRA